MQVVINSLGCTHTYSNESDFKKPGARRPITLFKNFENLRSPPQLSWFEIAVLEIV